MSEYIIIDSAKDKTLNKKYHNNIGCHVSDFDKATCTGIISHFS